MRSANLPTHGSGCEHLLPSIAGCRPLGLNAKFRCYRLSAKIVKPFPSNKHLILDRIISHYFLFALACGSFPGYQKGDYFKPHTDGSWDGSRITSKGFQSDAYGDRHSQLTFLILLTAAQLQLAYVILDSCFVGLSRY